MRTHTEQGLAWLLATLLIVVPFGCAPDDGSEETSTASGGAMNGGSGGLGGVGAGADTVGGAGAGGAGAGGSTGVAERSRGSVYFGTLYFYEPFGTYSFATAMFTRAGDPLSACTSTTYGPCVVTNCTDASEPSVVRPDAGTITIRSDEGFEAVAVSTAGQYSSTPTGVFTGGELTTVAATGAEVPAFSTSLTFPLSLLVTTPDYGTTADVVAVPRTQDLNLVWERGTAGVRMAAQSVNNDPSGLYCEVPSEAGAATLPSAALMQLAPGTEVQLLTMGRQTITAGEYDVSVVAEAAALTPDRTRRTTLLLQ